MMIEGTATQVQKTKLLISLRHSTMPKIQIMTFVREPMNKNKNHKMKQHYTEPIYKLQTLIFEVNFTDQNLG